MAIRVAALAVEIIRGGQPDRVKRDLKDVDRAGAKAGKSVIGLNNVLKAVGIGFSVVAITRGLRSVGRAFLDFDAAMVESLAIMGDVSAGMRDEMAEAAKDVAKTTTFSATQAAESYYFLASAGLDAQQSIAALPQVALFAQAGMFDMARATDLATDAQSALGLSVDDATENLISMARVTDVLVRAGNLANATVEQFSESLTNKAGAALKVVGKDIEEGVAVLAAFADQGLKGAEAGTALNIVFRDLQTKALKNKEEFAALGVAVYDADEEMRNAADIIGDLECALAGMSDAQKKATLLQLGFADKSVSFLQTILGQSDAIRGYERALRSAGGTTAEVAANQLQSFKAQLKLTTNTLQSMIITLVETVMPMFGFKEGLGDVRAALEDAEWWIKSNQDAIASWVTVIVASVTLVVQTFDLFGTTIKSVVKMAGDVLGNLGVMIVGIFKLVGDQLGNVGALLVGIFTFDLDLIKTSLGELKNDFVADLGAIVAVAVEMGKDFVVDLQPVRDELEQTADSFLDLTEAIANVEGPQRAPRGGRGGQDPTPTPGGQEPATEPFVFGGFEMDPDLIPKNVREYLEGLKLVSIETLQMIGEMADTIESGLEQTLGDAIANGLEAAFDTGSLKSFFAEFGKTLLAGFGDILVQLGQILIQYGITMEALRPFLTNIFTAGPAAIAAGMALIALGSAFSAITSSSGGVGRGTATAGAFREPSFGFSRQQADVSHRIITMGTPPTVQPQPAVNNEPSFGFSQQMADVSQRTISMGPAPTIQPQPSVVYNNTIIGPDDPTAQRQLTELLVKGQRRGLVLVP